MNLEGGQGETPDLLSVTTEELEALKQAYAESFGDSPTADELDEVAHRLATLGAILAKPVHREEFLLWLKRHADATSSTKVPESHQVNEPVPC